MSILPYRNEAEPKKRTLDQPQVVRAALALLDEVGIDDLTMRRLAERLGVKAASLYRHIKDKEDLLVLLADEVCGEIPLTPAVGTWRQQLVKIAHNVRRGLKAHRDAARLVAITPPFGPWRLRHIENLLRVLRLAGLSAGDAAKAAYHCNNFVTEFVSDEARFESFAASPLGSRRKVFAEARKHFRSLPVEEYPTLVELAGELTEDDSDALFEFGLKLWLRGLETLVGGKA